MDGGKGNEGPPWSMHADEERAANMSLKGIKSSGGQSRLFIFYFSFFSSKGTTMHAFIRCISSSTTLL